MTSWKLTLPCTRAEAESIGEDITPLALLDPLPVLMTSEPDPKRPDEWLLEVFFDEKPDSPTIESLRELLPSAAGARPKVERVPDEDWVALSQRGLEPIHAGRFFVHTPVHRGEAPAGAFAFEIDAGRAFGTGHHETTTGCLLALDRLSRDGAVFSNLLDLGTGTGLLAFAAMRLWPAARAAASDIDPIAVEVARANAAANGIPLGRARMQLELIAAPGLRHMRLRTRAPYDLIIANILAGPLIELAPAVAGALAPGGTLILAGLLDHQAPEVLTAYRRQGLVPLFTSVRGDWPTLVLRKRRRARAVRRAPEPKPR